MLRKLLFFIPCVLVMFVVIVLSSACNRPSQATVSIFPLTNYDQTISAWIKPSDPGYDQPLLSQEQQTRRLAEFYNHYFSSDESGLSPWSPSHIQQVLQQPPSNSLATSEKGLIQDLTNEDKDAKDIAYGENFRPHSAQWMDKIVNNMNLAQLNSSLTYQPGNRAIAVNNLLVRALPTDDPHFYSYKLGGQGYPFDNLQMSALWAGTPVYILGESRDAVWSLILAPGFIGWVKSDDIAQVNQAFVTTWQTAAKNKLAAITHTKTTINTIHHQQHFYAYVGTVFPVAKQTAHSLTLMIPVKDTAGQASIDYAEVSTKKAAIMPLLTTPHHFAQIMATLQGRPYGWGNIYFYNDCSAELKNLFTPFAIWLPRHSSKQIEHGVLVDKSAASMEERLNYLIKNGHKLMTIIYIGGHVMLYLGAYPNPHSAQHSLMAMTYQAMWGLSPPDRKEREVIGKSVLFPLLAHYSENPKLVSEADKSYFQIAYLDQMPIPSLHKIELHILMYPELPLDANAH